MFQKKEKTAGTAEARAREREATDVQIRQSIDQKKYDLDGYSGFKHWCSEYKRIRLQ
jgi:hypothetical protein